MPFHRQRDDLTAEMRAHLEHEEADLRASGMGAEEARRAARLRFGNVTLAQERVADGRLHRWCGTLWQDVRFGTRLLRRSPAFTFTAAMVLALGIGVNSALFSIVSSLYVPSLGVPSPERLGYFVRQNAGLLSREEARFFEHHGQDLANFARHAYAQSSTLATSDRLEHINRQLVDGRYFDVVGVPMAQGRRLRVDDGDPANSTPSAVISHRLWSRVMSSDPQVIGKTVMVDEQPVVIVGVAHLDFKGLSDPARPVDCWIVATDDSIQDVAQLVFRLRSGREFSEMVAMVAAQAPILQQERWNSFAPEVRQQRPDFLRRRPYQVFRATTVTRPFFPDARPIPASMLVGLFAVVGLVWLIATTNVSGLLMARGASRTGELAVRRALGASRGRITRQILTESALLAVTGGLAGLLLAVGLVPVFTAYAPPSLAVEIELDWQIAVVSSTLAVAAGLVVGTAPALQAVRVQVLASLTNGAHAGARTDRRVSRWILVPQVAASVALLVVAAVHTRPLARVEWSPGFETDGVQSLRVALREARPLTSGMNFEQMWRTPDEVRQREREVRLQRQARYRQTLLEKARTLPDVTAFGLVGMLPLPPFGLGTVRPQVILREDYEAGLESRAAAITMSASSGYFDAMRIPILRGRTFRESGGGDGLRETVVSASLAHDLGQGRDVLGRSMASLDPTGKTSPVWYQIVGVVSDVATIATVEHSPVNTRVSRPVDSIAYKSLHQDWAMGACCLVVRGNNDALADPQRLRAIALAADPMADIASVRSLEDLVAEAHYPRRLASLLLISAGMVGLVLAIAGLYGAVAYAAAQRLREIGVRAALGATRRQLTLLLVSDGAKVLAVGTVGGLAFGIAALRLTAASYPDLPPVDWVSFTAVPTVLAAVVLLACLLPARRAAHTDPAKVLRGD